MLNKFQILTIIFLLMILMGCTKKEEMTGSKPGGAEPSAQSMGVGPVTSEIHIDNKIDVAMAAQGKTLFEAKCTACHKFETKYVGPALQGVTKRRRSEWIMNMILNPAEMIQKDETAKALLAEHLTQMANQNLTQDQTRAVLEYFRQHDLGH